MNKEVYVDYVHKDSQTIGTYSMESKQKLAIYNPRPEDTKVNIWGYELCNGAEWQDFLDVINKLGHENKILSKALELMKDSKNYYLFVNENNETINVDFALQQAEKELKNGN